MALAYVSGEYMMKEMSEWLYVYYLTVSRAVKLIEGECLIARPDPAFS